MAPAPDPFPVPRSSPRSSPLSPSSLALLPSALGAESEAGSSPSLAPHSAPGSPSPEERRAAAGRWLAEVGGSATPGEVGLALGLNHARQADALRVLLADGLVRKPSPRLVELTAAGWALFSGASGAAGAGPVVDGTLASVLPDWAFAHLAWSRLMISATIARHSLSDSRPDHHLGFAAFGGPGTGKTTAAQLVCRILGLDPARHVVNLDDESAGSLRGRRVQESGGWRLESSPFAGLPLVAFDELEKATDEAQRSVWRFLRGQGVIFTEGTRYVIRPVTVVAGNAPRNGDLWSLLPTGTRRRAALLATDYVAGRERELGRAIRDGLRSLDPAARVSLDRLRPPAGELDAEGLAVLDLVDQLVTPGHGPVPSAGLELAALGRLALLPEGTAHAAAAAAVVLDWLTVTETTPGMVVTGWRSWLDLGGGDDPAGLAESLERGRAARAAALEAVEAGRRSVALAADEMARDRARLSAGLDEWRDGLDGRRLLSWPPALRVRAKGERARLARLREAAADVRSRAGLEDLAPRVAEAGTAVQQLHADAAAHEAEEERARTLEALAAQSRSRLALEARRSAEAPRRAAAADLDRLMRWVQELERLWVRRGPALDGAPVVFLSRVRVPRDGQEWVPLVVFVPDPVPESPGVLRSLGAILAAAGGGGVPGAWVDWQGQEIGRGTASHCMVLTLWGAGTQALLVPWLRWAYSLEDQLRSTSGQRPRPARPYVLPRSLARF